ncbi:MAG: hypothetical protein ACK4VI_06755 [Alphaproteobacteria bacterium]
MMSSGSVFKFLALGAVVITAAACAFTMDKDFQPLTVRTTGAQNSVCDVWADNVRFKFYPPETRNVKNSKENLVIHCYAPGNRERKVIIKPEYSKYAYGNILTGVIPGVIVDYTSGAMFKYPRAIDIDFSHMPPTTMPAPQHNNLDILDHSEHNLEEFRPGWPQLNSDRHRTEQPLMRRVRPGSELDSYSASGFTGGRASGGLDEKSDFMRVINNLSGDETPADIPTPVLEMQERPQVTIIESRDVLDDATETPDQNGLTDDFGDPMEMGDDSGDGSAPMQLIPTRRQ